MRAWVNVEYDADDHADDLSASDFLSYLRAYNVGESVVVVEVKGRARL